MKKITTFLAACLLVAGVSTSIVNAGTGRAVSGVPDSGDNRSKVAADEGVADDEESAVWTEVSLDAPGSLGVEILYKVDQLADVTHLRVIGEMNANDWATIRNCANLTDLDLGQAITNYVPAQQFENNKKITSVILPPTLTRILRRAFYGSTLKQIVIPASVNYLDGDNHFGSSSLENVTFEDGCQLESLSPNMFGYCSSLKSVRLHENLKVVGDQSFRNCTKLSVVNLPSSLTTISTYAFYYDRQLAELVFPENLSYIGNDAFNSTALTSIILPESVTYIGSSAFSNCNSATEVTMPSQVIGYESSVFSNCNSVAKITCSAAVPPYRASSYDPFGFPASAELIVPDFAVVDYKLDDYWHEFASIKGGASSSNYVIYNRQLSMTDSRRFDNVPNVSISTNGKFQISGASALQLKNLSFYVDQYNASFGQLINSSPAMTAETVSESFSYRSSGYWQFFTLPFDVRMSDISVSNAGASYVIRYYDGETRATNNSASNNWKDMPEDGVLEAGKGYIICCSASSVTFTFNALGTDSKLFGPNARVCELETNACENAANAGWNFVGNPWASYYDMYYSMLTCPITMWDFSNRKYVAYSLIDDNVILRPGDAFFVQADAELSEIEFGTKGRQFNNILSRTESARNRMPVADGRSLFNLTLASGELTDDARVVLNENASEDYEASRDAAKFLSDAEDVPQLYTIDAEGTRLAINERPEGDGVINLGLYAPRAGKMTISAGRVDGKATIHDRLTGKSMSLADNVKFEFETETAGYLDNRFYLTLAPSVSTSVTNLNEDAPRVAVDGGEVTVSGAEAPIEVYSLNGESVASREAACEVKFELVAGVYVIKVGGYSYKCIIR